MEDYAGLPGKISIHAPTRGATLFQLAGLQLIRISIHAPTRGATEINEEVKKAMKISIHAPTRGATAKPKGRHGSSKFQSTLPQGERHRHKVVLNQWQTFQSTLPQGERL